MPTETLAPVSEQKEEKEAVEKNSERFDKSTEEIESYVDFPELSEAQKSKRGILQENTSMRF
jgi:hypothetical protein